MELLVRCIISLTGVTWVGPFDDVKDLQHLTLFAVGVLTFFETGDDLRMSTCFAMMAISPRLHRMESSLNLSKKSFWVFQK
jgi:hypothetical protein